MLNYSECRKLLDSCMNNRFRLTNFGGCYNCLYSFDYSKIHQWTKNTAHCPKCNCESVLDDPSDNELESMCKQWCGFEQYLELKEKQNYERKLNARKHFQKLNNRHKHKAKLLRIYKQNAKNKKPAYWLSEWLKV